MCVLVGGVGRLVGPGSLPPLGGVWWLFPCRPWPWFPVPPLPSARLCPRWGCAPLVRSGPAWWSSPRLALPPGLPARGCGSGACLLASPWSVAALLAGPSPCPSRLVSVPRAWWLSSGRSFGARSGAWPPVSLWGLCCVRSVSVPGSGVRPALALAALCRGAPLLALVLRLGCGSLVLACLRCPRLRLRLAAPGRALLLCAPLLSPRRGSGRLLVGLGSRARSSLPARFSRCPLCACLPLLWAAASPLCLRAAALAWGARWSGVRLVLGLVGFCGARSLPASFAGLVGAVVGAVQAGGGSVAVGCAAGADQLVRAAAPAARVFAVSSGRWGSGRAAFARRSAALVGALAGSGPGASFVGFVSSPCPAGLVPSPSASACFCGLGSGSWASLALAAGRGVPVVVFWCAAGPAVLPAWPGGSWAPASGAFAGGWALVPAASPSRLPGF